MEIHRKREEEFKQRQKDNHSDLLKYNSPKPEYL
jgi:hypothetical protein